jgi:hypothetical protein
MKQALKEFDQALTNLYLQAQKHDHDCDCSECNRVWGELLHAMAQVERAREDQDA